MQVGKSCTSPDQERAYTKLRKDSNQSMYGVYKNYEWDEEDITLAEANALLNQIGSDFAKSGRSKSSSPSAGMVESYSSGSQYVHNTNCLGY